MRSADAPRRGTLLAVGGREDRTGDARILGRFVDLCGGAAARLMVVSTASKDPEEKRAEYELAFRKFGVASVRFFHPDDRADAEDSTMLAEAEQADGVFFTGGNQLKLVTTLGGTKLLSRLRERHQEGLHLGGTSAGASALSAVMIARGKARSAARLGSLRMTPGFAILPNIVVDQHFRERDRFGRLIAAVLCNPKMLGFGLDEDTGFVLDAEDRVGVIGTGTLTIVDGAALEATDIALVPEESPAGFSGMRLHVLSEGWAYDVGSRRVDPPLAAAAETDSVAADSGNRD